MRAFAMIAMVVVALLSFSGLNHSNPRYIKKPKNGPYRIHFENILKPGPWKIEPLYLASLNLPPLPPGYAALHNEAFRLSTTAIVSGLYFVQFVVPSVKEEREFRNLRILLLDNDSVWRDVTVLDFDKAPVFAARAMLAQSESLGVYVIAKLVPEAPPNKAAADLVVSIDGGGAVCRAGGHNFRSHCL